MPRDLCFTPATELSRLYRSRKVSPLEVMRAVLERLDRVNPLVNAVVTLDREAALREARRATAALTRRSAALGPLHGIPVGIKDVTPTKGMRTTFGSKLFEDHIPMEDAAVVERLKAAGAIVLGKTNTPEFAFGPNTVNAVFGATRNPWNLARTAGGSSGGPGGGPGHGDVPARRRHGSRRVLEGAGGPLRGGGLPDHAGTDPAASLRARLGHVRRRVAQGAHRGRRRADALGDGGPGPALADVVRGGHARAEG